MGLFRKKKATPPAPRSKYIEPAVQHQCGRCREMFHNMRDAVEHDCYPDPATNPRAPIIVPPHMATGRAAAINRRIALPTPPRPAPEPTGPKMNPDEIINDLQDLLGELDDDPTT